MFTLKNSGYKYKTLTGTMIFEE